MHLISIAKSSSVCHLNRLIKRYQSVCFEEAGTCGVAWPPVCFCNISSPFTWSLTLFMFTRPQIWSLVLAKFRIWMPPVLRLFFFIIIHRQQQPQVNKPMCVRICLTRRDVWVHTQVLTGIGASGVQPFMQGGARRINTHNQHSMHSLASWLIKCVYVCVYVPVWSRENSRNRSCTVRRSAVFLSFIPLRGFYFLVFISHLKE